MAHRPQRLAHELRNQVSAIIARELHDPRLGFTTVTEVKVSRDLRHARVYVSILETGERKQETMAALRSAAPWIRHTVFTRLRLRHSPEIVFSLDESVEHGDKMSRLLDEVSREMPPADDASARADDRPDDLTTKSDDTPDFTSAAEITLPRAGRESQSE